MKNRLKGCFLDLIGAMIIGSKSDQFAVGLRLAETIYGKGDIPTIGSDKTFGFMGPHVHWDIALTLMTLTMATT